MYEYNELTKALLAEGYSTEDYPDYVEIDTSRLPGTDPLHNSGGGFVYKRSYIQKMVYMTGCGMCVKGDNTISNMTYNGSWKHENDCPVIHCPIDREKCEANDKRLHKGLRSGLSYICFCVCHRTNHEYNYETSFEKAWAEKRMEIQRKYDEYALSHNGKVCMNHMYYNHYSRTWRFQYKPLNCARKCHLQSEIQEEKCPILGRFLDKKKGNVYYDLKISGIYHDDTLFNGQAWTRIEKGIRFFEHQVSMDICTAFVKHQPAAVWEYVEREKLSRMLLYDQSITMEVLNIRAESRPSRNLEEDLEDIKNGIEVVHASDLNKKNASERKERREKAKEKRIEKLEKKLIEIGYDDLEHIDRYHAKKWIPEERLTELEIKREEHLMEKRNQPIQMKIEDFL
mgnify:CR=1 FL=1